MASRAAAPVIAAARHRSAQPPALRALLFAIAVASLALMAATVGVRLATGSAEPAVGLAAGTFDEPVCAPLEEAPDSGLVGCAHADERPAGLPSGEPTLDELVARAGGAASLAAFADTPTVIDAAAGPPVIDITDGPVVHGGGSTDGEPSTPDATDGVDATAAVRPDGSMSAYSTVPAGGTPGIPCIGDGKSGNRVQALYVYPSDRSSRLTQLAPLIRRWAADVDRVVRLSAAQKSAKRHVRWVTTSGCALTITPVKLTTATKTSFSKTISELAAKGYKRTDRRYLIWYDASYYCGIGRFIADDRGGASNKNNGAPYGPAGYARVDSGCWGALSGSGVSVEAHELMHTIGAVQSSAPRSTRVGHCYDEYDTMCYADGGRGPLTYPCAATSNEAYLDCGKNDYFNPKPASGTYLALKWNTARSSFFSSTASGDPLIETASRGSPTGALTASTATVSLSWKAVLDATQTRTRIEVAKDGGAYAALKTVTGTAKTTTVSLARGHTYALRLRAEDSAGRWSAWWVLPSVWVEPVDLPPSVSDVELSLAWRDGETVVIQYGWAEDDDGYVVAVEAELSTAGGPWTPLPDPYVESWFDGAVNVAYQVRLRAQDDVGQWSAWAVSSPFTVTDTPPTVGTPDVDGAFDLGDGTMEIWLSWTSADDDQVVATELEERIGGAAAVAVPGTWWDGAQLWGREIGVTHEYRVRVQDGAGQWSAWSAWSAPVSAPTT